MSVKAQKSVVAFLQDGGGRGLSPSCVSVLRLIGWFASEEDGRAWPCENTLTRLSGLSLRGVRDAINGLVSAGLVGREARTTRAGNGWYYWLTLSKTIGAMVASNADNRGNGCLINRGKSCINRGNGCLSIGAMVAPDKEEINKISECDSGAAHTQWVVDNSKDGVAGSSPFGVYDVGDAVRRLADGDNPVPRSFIEGRARTLTADGGVLAKGGKVTAEAFVAHCRTWWANERDKGRYLAPASAAKSRGGFPLAERGEDKEAWLCGEAGCADCIGINVCGKGYVPPDLRDSPCRPDDKLGDGSYRSGCFRPKEVGL